MTATRQKFDDFAHGVGPHVFEYARGPAGTVSAARIKDDADTVYMADAALAMFNLGRMALVNRRYGKNDFGYLAVRFREPLRKRA